MTRKISCKRSSCLRLLSLLILLKLEYASCARSLETQRKLSAHTDSCTNPHILPDGPKPYCYVPNTISEEAQKWLATAHTLQLPEDFAINTTAVKELRKFAGSANGRLSKRASQQYLVGISNSTMAGVPVVHGTPKSYKQVNTENKLIIYLHGGGYIFNSCYTQWQMVALIAQASGIRVVCIEYRLAPEHPHPAALHDALAVYKQLVTTYDASNIAVLGDSAGGGLALAMVIQLQREANPLPAAVVLFSPWVDLTNQGDTLTTLHGVDPALNPESMRMMAEMYVAGDRSKLSDPLVSPLKADYAALFPNSTLPPTLLQLGTRDSLLSSSILLYRRLKAAGQMNMVYSPWEAMWHNFEQNLQLPEARAAQEEAANFIMQYMKDS